jgi:hypothetical protein
MRLLMLVSYSINKKATPFCVADFQPKNAPCFKMGAKIRIYPMFGARKNELK